MLCIKTKSLRSIYFVANCPLHQWTHDQLNQHVNLSYHYNYISPACDDVKQSQGIVSNIVDISCVDK